MKIVTLALLLVAPVQASVVRADEWTPWRLGAPEVVWRYRPPARPIPPPHLGTLFVHPEGGVVAVARTAREQLTFFRVTPSGTKPWERNIATAGYAQYAHVTFLPRPHGTDAIITGSTFVARVSPDGAVRWAVSAGRLGFDQIGIAIARRLPFGEQVVVGGTGYGEEDRQTGRAPVRAMAAGLDGDGSHRWLAALTWSNGPAARRGRSHLFPADQDDDPDDAGEVLPVALPLRVLDDGGALLLLGCGELGAFTAGVGRAPAPPCQGATGLAMATVDGTGRLRDATPVGGRPLLFPADLRALQVDTWLDAQEEQGTATWESHRLPNFLPTVWWFGERAAAIANLLRGTTHRNAIGDIAAYGGEPLMVVAHPAADVAFEGDTQYLVLAPAATWGPDRAMLFAVRQSGAVLLAARAIPPIQRLRYAPREHALYGLRGNDLLRWRVHRVAR